MSPKIQPALRRAVPSDAADLWAVRGDALCTGCRGHYPAALLAALAADPVPETFPDTIARHYFVVALIGQRIAGFAALKPDPGMVDAVFVRAEAMGRGVGAALLAHVEEQAKSLGLTALSLKASLNAVAFYERAGYVAGEPGRHVTRSGHEIACVHMDKRLADPAAA